MSASEALREELAHLREPLINEFCKGNDRYGVLVYGYLFGQYRIQLTDRQRPEYGAPDGHGSIVQLLDTYDPLKLIMVVRAILNADDPLALCESKARPWNTNFVGDRIRLDNKPEDRPERVTRTTPIDAPIDEAVYVRCEGDGDMVIPRLAVKRIEANPQGDGYVFSFYEIDLQDGERDEPLFNEETGKSSVVECYVVNEEAQVD